MMHSANDLMNFLIFGIDGFLGPIRDIYFDDSDWTIRYLIMELPEPDITSRHLISPLAIKEIRWAQKEIHVHLDLEKIRNSPDIDINLPIPRQNEITLLRYHQWPMYWKQSPFFDNSLSESEKSRFRFEDYRDSDEMSDLFSEVEEYEDLRQEPFDEELIETEFGSGTNGLNKTVELRSFSEISGFKIQSKDEIYSPLSDIWFNSSDYLINYLSIELGKEYSSEKILLTLNWINDIIWSKSLIKINLSQENLNKAPRLMLQEPISKDFEQKTKDYYNSL